MLQIKNVRLRERWAHPADVLVSICARLAELAPAQGLPGSAAYLQPVRRDRCRTGRNVGMMKRLRQRIESMNSKQASRYIKRRMGDAVKKQILKRDGILLEDKSMQRVAILRHYINIIWHYGWHILCKAKSQIILPISCIYHQTVFWKCLPAAASNAYSFASSAGSNA
jgi:hypothetical protein